MFIFQNPIFNPLLFLLFQGKVLQHNVGLGIIISNQSLVLQGVSRSTAGNYTCVGYNTEGDGESEPFYLNVMCEYDYTSHQNLRMLNNKNTKIP